MVEIGLEKMFNLLPREEKDHLEDNGLSPDLFQAHRETLYLIGLTPEQDYEDNEGYLIAKFGEDCKSIEYLRKVHEKK